MIRPTDEDDKPNYAVAVYGPGHVHLVFVALDKMHAVVVGDEPVQTEALLATVAPGENPTHVLYRAATCFLDGDLRAAGNGIDAVARVSSDEPLVALIAACRAVAEIETSDAIQQMPERPRTVERLSVVDGPVLGRGPVGEA